MFSYVRCRFTFVRVYYLTIVEWKEFFPGSPLIHFDYGSRNKDLSGMCIGCHYLNGSPALRSFIYVDGCEPTSHPCSMTGMRQDHLTPALTYSPHVAIANQRQNVLMTVRADFFFLQCRTSTRHGRSTTGNGKDCGESPW